MVNKTNDQIQVNALSAFVIHLKRMYTGDPKNHKDWSAFQAGFEAGRKSTPCDHVYVTQSINGHIHNPAGLTGICRKCGCIPTHTK